MGKHLFISHYLFIYFSVISFIQLKARLINTLMNALQVETDAQNTHMLLGGLLLTVQDAVTFEETELVGTEHLRAASPTPGDTNLLSSGMLKSRP